MYATDFKFDHELLSSYGMILCSFNGSSSFETKSNGADIELTTVRVPGSNIWNHVYSKYQEVLSGTFSICKKTCNGENPYITVAEQRAINRWLNRLDKFYPFMIIQDGYENIYYNAQINVKKVELDGKVVGFELTLVTDKPYGYMIEQKRSFNIVNISDTYKIANISDDIGRVDVKMKVVCGEDGDLKIHNSLTNTTCYIRNCTKGEIIEIDTRLKKVTSSIRASEELLKNDIFNFKYPYLTKTYKEDINVYSFSMPCYGELIYSPIVKVSF